MAHRTGAGIDDLRISGTADGGNVLRLGFHEIEQFSIHLSSVQGELPMNSLSTTTGWRGWLGQSLSRSKVTARSRRQTRRRSGALIEQLEDRTLLSSLDITSGVLTYDGSNPTPAASRLTVSETAGVYTFTDLDQTI